MTFQPYECVMVVSKKQCVCQCLSAKWVLTKQCVGQMAVGQMAVGQMAVGQMAVGQMGVD